MIATFVSVVIPPGLAGLDLLLLVATSFATALMTAVLGVGGGVALLAVTASILPPLAIIPVHGLVQAGANTNRAVLTRRHLNRSLFTDFTLGAVVGAVIAALIVVQLPADVILLAVGSFVLYLTWGPKLPHKALRGWPLRFAAALTTLISMFVGASGPLVAAFTQQLSAERFVRVATFSACMSVQHGLKIAVFGGLGFAFSDWLGLIAAMIVSGFAGTWIGLHLLTKVSNEQFSRVFRWVLTLLALRLLYTGVAPLLT
ncbi:sulfite exporter TauE/SafE family protein [Motiliproteus sediminis]|uniref:sulfite exporter TauE/SafE family protein n=1 Tax=Motiliproteus sediminis TaxID=1468178 RepID=UPI001AEF8D44|nr:sulfite exporter TauE/SafE family protein [Motiliproteus sediminis]